MTRLMYLFLVFPLFCGCSNQLSSKLLSEAETASDAGPESKPTTVTSSNGKQVTFYPTSGYLQGEDWTIELRGWVRERREHLNAFVTGLAKITDRCNGQNMDIFTARSDAFESDDKFGEDIAMEFDSDPDKATYSFIRSDLNGIVKRELTLPKSRAEQLLKAQDSPNKWLTYRVTSAGYVGAGRIRLTEPKGISIVSDIDDTIKVTEIPVGQSRVFDRTFCREFEAAPGMANRYKDWSDPLLHPDWSDVAFHYVSGGPEQLFGPLYEFLVVGRGEFSEGSFHLHFYPKNILSSETRRNLRRFAAGSMSETYRHKVHEISKLMEHFPQRDFILVGDSGEIDPEVYAEIRRKYPQRVKQIWIRDVVDDARDNDYRLTGMEVIKVETAVCMDQRHYDNLSRIVNQTYNSNKYKKVIKSCD